MPEELICGYIYWDSFLLFQPGFDGILSCGDSCFMWRCHGHLLATLWLWLAQTEQILHLVAVFVLSSREFLVLPQPGFSFLVVKELYFSVSEHIRYPVPLLKLSWKDEECGLY